MDAPWYERPMRIAALQCNYEGGKTLEVADRWARMGFNVEQLFHPMADGYSALFDPTRHRRALADYARRARRRGLRIIVYLNVHILGPSQNDRRDEWAQRDADGRFPKMYGTYYACCLNSPWRKHFFAVLDALEPFDIDGVFLDGPASIEGGCRCPHCAARYREQFGADIDDGEQLDAFRARTRHEFLLNAYHRFKKIKPEGVFYMNLNVTHPSRATGAVADALAYNDLVGTEGGFMFYGPPKEADLWKPAMAAKLLEAIAPDRPRVVFMAADQKPWSWYPHTAAETKLCIASIVANGANLWYGLHGSTRLLDTPGCRAAADLVRFLAQHEDAYDRTESVARVAVLFSYDTALAYRTARQESDLYDSAGGRSGMPGNFTESFRGIVGALARSGVPFDLVADLPASLERLGRYDCVFLPTCACLSDATVAGLRAYVSGGGNLVATFDTSLYDPAGQRRDDFALADVFGVSATDEIIRYGNHNYFSTSSKDALFEGIRPPLLPAAETALAVTAAPGAEVLARFLGVMAGRYVDLEEPEHPAVVRNRFGEGTCVYLAGAFGEMCDTYHPPEYRRLLANAAARLARSPVRIENAGNVVVAVRRRADRLLVHLINYAGLSPRPFESVAPQRGIRLRVADDRYGEARALVSGCPCEWEREEGELVVSIPELFEYEVIALA
jgi:hypothetical protein